MTESEGVVQYRLDHRPGRIPETAGLGRLFHWFRRCRELDLIGCDPGRYGGLAYGNISIRVHPGFVISGTQTGGLAALHEADLAWVEAWDPGRNRVRSSGPARPSSEALTHGQVYRALPGVNAVIHVHSPVIWRHARALGLPVTDTAAGYGTPAMAAEVARLLGDAPHGSPGVFSMGGHEDGIVAYAASMDIAGDALLDALARARAAQNG